MITMERDLINDIRANPFGAVVVHSENEEDARKRAEKLELGNALIARAFERHVEREMARETR